MMAITADQLTIKCGLNIQSVLGVELHSAVNRHGSMLATCILNKVPDNAFLLCPAQQKDIILSYGQDGKEQVLFAGKVTENVISVENGTCIATLSCQTNSILLDQAKLSRSFLNPSITYQDILTKAATGAGYIHVFDKGMQGIKKIAIQYNETPWRFSLRMAGRCRAPVIPDTTSKEPRISVGFPNRKAVELEKGGSYQTTWSKESRSLCYEIESTANYELGDSIKIEGKTLFVSEKSMAFHNDSFLCRYKLVPAEAAASPVKSNSSLAGASLWGKVVCCEEESMQLCLEIDSYRPQDGACFFPYVPVSGNIMYSMPEPGARVCLFFPNEQEAGAYVQASMLEPRKTARKHRAKAFTTPNRKTMSMTPESINFSGKQDRMSIVDDMHTYVSSDARLRLRAKKKISIKSKGMTTLQSVNHLLFRHNPSETEMDIACGEINLTASKIMNSTVLSSPQEAYEQLRSRAAASPVGTQLGDSVLGMLGTVPAGKMDPAIASVTASVPTVNNPSKPVSIAGEQGLYSRK